MIGSNRGMHVGAPTIPESGGGVDGGGVDGKDGGGEWMAGWGRPFCSLLADSVY